MDATKLMRLACRVERKAPHLADELELMARSAQIEVNVPQARLQRMYQSGGGAKPAGGTSLGGFHQKIDLGSPIPSNPGVSQAAMNIVIGGGGVPNPKMIGKEAQRLRIDPNILAQHVRRLSSLYSMGYTDPSLLNRMMGQSGNMDLIAISNSPATGFSAMGGRAGIRQHELQHMRGATGTRKQMMDRALAKSRSIGGGVMNQEQLQNYWNSTIDWMMAGRDNPEEYGANMPVFEQHVMPQGLKKLHP